MKNTLIIILMLVLGVGMLSAQTKKAKPTIGKVVALNEIYLGSFTEWTKETATQAADKGTPFVLHVGTGKTAKVYIVLNEDGTFAGKKLAKYAFNKKVGIIGKVVTKSGLKYIVAETIESVE